MPLPDVPSPSAVALSRAEKEKLLQKMYTLPHWIAIIRLFGYQTLVMDRAREAIKPIAEQYGKPDVADACEVLVEIVSAGKNPIARLKPHIRHMAFQILGPESKKLEGAPAPADPLLAARVKARARGAKAEPVPEGRPAKQSRYHVVKQCEAWLNTEKLSFVAIEDVKRTTPAVVPHVSSLDFIVLRGDDRLLVTVRPHLLAKHLAAIAELQKLFGPHYRPVRLWPIEGPEGWVWQEHAIEPSEATGD